MADQKLKLKISAETKEAREEIKRIAKESAEEIKRIAAESKKAKQQEKESARDLANYKKSLAKEEAQSNKQIAQQKREDEKRSLQQKKELEKQALEQRRQLEKESAAQQSDRKQKVLGLTSLDDIKKLKFEMALLGNEQIKLFQNGQKDSQAFKDNQQKIDQLKNSIKELTGVSKGFSGKTPLSGFQILEGLENITVAIAGFKAAIGGFAGLVSESARKFADFKEIADNFRGTAEDIDLFQKATGRVVGKGDLLKLSNQATDLGIPLKVQPVLFLAAKEAAEKYGISVEEGFQKIVSATEGQVRGVKAIGIQKAEYNEVVESLVKSIGGEIEINQGLNGEQEITIKNLDFATQKRIRLEAFLQIYGKTVEDVNKRQQTDADKLHQLDLLLPQVKKQFGELVAKGLIPMSEALKTNEGKFNDTTVAIAGIGFAFTDLVPAIASARLAFSGFGASAVAQMAPLITAAAALLGAFAVIKETIGNMNISEGVGNLLLIKAKLDTLFGGGTSESTKTIPPEFDTGKNMKVPNVNFDNIKTKDKTGGKGNSGTKTKEVEEITNELIEKQKELNELLKKEITFTADQKTQQVYLNYLEEVKKLKSEIAILSSQPAIFSTDGIVLDERKIPVFKKDDILQAQYQAESDAIKKLTGETKKTFEDTFSMAFSEAQNIASVLNLGADTFGAKFLSYLDKGLSLANSIINIISLFAGGSGGGLFGLLSGGGASAAGLLSPVNQINGNNGAGRNLYLRVDSNYSKIVEDHMPEYYNKKNSIRVDY